MKVTDLPLHMVETVYDVGACVGSWTREFREIVPGADFLLFEANENCREKLSAETHFIVPLSDEEKYVTFYSNGGIDTGESYYRENTTHYDNPVETTVKTTTLNKMVKEIGMPVPDYLKIDTQGAELDILKGSSEFLSDVTYIQLEMPVIPYNDGGASFSDITQYLAAHGHYPVAITDELYSDDFLVQVDMIFMHKDKKTQYISDTPHLILK